jgi:hypothetical protein
MKKRNLFNELMEGLDALGAERKGKGQIKKSVLQISDKCRAKEESGTLTVTSTSPKDMSCPRRKSP